MGICKANFKKFGEWNEIFPHIKIEKKTAIKNVIKIFTFGAK